MIALYIILGIIVFFVLLLSIRAKIHIEYKSGDKPIMSASWAFLKFSILPAEKKEKKPKKPKSEKPKEEKKPEEQEEEPKEKKESPVKIFYENEQLAGFAELAQRFFELLYKFGIRMGKCFIFDEAFLDLGVTGSDAAETAVKYGKYCSSVFPAFGALCANCQVKDYNVNVYPDFVASPGNKTEMIFTFAVIPRKLINTFIMFGVGVVFKVLLRFLKGAKRKDAPSKDKAEPAQNPDQDNNTDIPQTDTE